MPFKDLHEGQTHSMDDGCGEPEHNPRMTPIQKRAEEIVKLHWFATVSCDIHGSLGNIDNDYGSDDVMFPYCKDCGKAKKLKKVDECEKCGKKKCEKPIEENHQFNWECAYVKKRCHGHPQKITPSKSEVEEDGMFSNDKKARKICVELEREFGYVNDNYPGFIGVMETKIAIALSSLRQKTLMEVRKTLENIPEGNPTHYSLDYALSVIDELMENNN